LHERNDVEGAKTAIKAAMKRHPQHVGSEGEQTINTGFAVTFRVFNLCKSPVEFCVNRQ
jgi:hypothetical protein